MDTSANTITAMGIISDKVYNNDFLAPILQCGSLYLQLFFL